MTRPRLAHWTRHLGPNNWFGFATPPSWEVSASGGTVTVRAPDDGGVLTISSVWVGEGPEAQAQPLWNPLRIFPRQRGLRPLKPPDDRAGIIGLEGEAVLEELPWWRRWFRRPRWRRWRAWSLRQGPVQVVVLYVQSASPDREAETMTTLVVGSIEFNPSVACPPEVFTSRVLELARRLFPLLDCQPAADFQIRIGDSRINLFNFYRTYINAPDQFEAIVRPALLTVVQMQDWDKSHTEPPLMEVQERIMPMLYPEEVWQEQFPDFVGGPWVGGLVVLYVVDESNAYWFIRRDLLESWGLSVDELHGIALENLNRYFEETPMEFTVAGVEEGPRLLIPNRQDAYNTTRLLSEQFHARLRHVLGGQFAVGAPSRDFFVAVSLESQATVDDIRKKVEADFQQMDHPLSNRLLLVTLDGVTEFSPWV
ncbi:MAG: DUF1444 family protein [Planctomycetales bacterium]